MSPHEYFIQACLECPEWDSVTCDVPLALTVHRYPDQEWWVMWHEPKNAADLGRIVNTPEDLRRCLEGKPFVGKQLNLDTANCA